MCILASAHGAGKKFPSALIVASLILSCLFTRIARGLPQDTIAAEVDEQIQELKSKDPNARVVAVRRLREIGPGSKEARGALIAALKDDPEPWVREYAAESLGYIGSGEPEVTRALTNALQDPKPWVRNYAAAALERLGPASPDVISALITDLRDQAQGEEGKCYAVDALGSIGTGSPDAIDALIVALNDKSDDVQRHAIHALAMLRTDSPYLTEAIHALSTALNHLGPTAKGRAAQALGRFGPAAQEAVPVLTDVLNDKAVEPGVRAQAAAALGQIGPGAQKAVPALIDVLKDSAGDPGVRASAATALGQIGPGAQEAVSALVAALKDPNPEIQRTSAFALDRIGPAAKEAVSPLIDALHGSAPGVKAQAAYALGDIAPDAPEVVRALGDALADGDPEVGAHAAVMLAKMGPNAQEAVPKLRDALKDRGKPKVALQAACSLSKIVPGSRDTIFALTAVLKDQDSAPEVRKQAADALASIAANARDSRRIDLIAPLEQAAAALGKDTSFDPQVHAVRGALDLLRAMQPLPQRLLDESGRHPVVAGAVAVYAGLFLVSVALLFLYPLALLRVGQAVSGLSGTPTLSKVIGVGEAVFAFGLFRFHPRVLDAWIAKHIDAARKQFNNMTTVRDREVHVDEVPAELDETVIPGLRPKDLEQAFGHDRTCILLWGEGG